MTTRTIMFYPEDVEPTKVVEEAIGRLALWGLPGYPHVDIYRDREKTDYIAVYREHEGGDAKFTLGAIWHKDSERYGYHS